MTNTQARKTALIVAGMLLLLAAWNYHRGRTFVVAVLSGIGAVLVVIGLLLPTLAVGFHVFWMRVASIFGWVNSRILLGLLFYGVFAPYNLIGRLLRRDKLDRRKPRQSSYWIRRKHTRQTKERFERTF